MMSPRRSDLIPAWSPIWSCGTAFRLRTGTSGTVIAERVFVDSRTVWTHLYNGPISEIAACTGVG